MLAPVLPGLSFFPLNRCLIFLLFLERESNILSIVVFLAVNQSRWWLTVVINGWLASWF